jgi:hypothetical protein
MPTRLRLCCAVLAAFLSLASSAAAATRSVAPGAADGGDCVAAACGSLGNAYQQSQPGDIVLVRAGDYGPQSVPGGSKPVTFRGDPGNKLRQLLNQASNVTYDGIEVDAGFTTPTGAAFESGGVPNVTFKNGRIGNVIDEKGALLGGSSSPASLGTVIDNVEFHDVYQDGSEVHNECIFSQAPGLVVRNSTFRNCATMDLMITRGDWWGQPTYGGVTLENNVFAHSVNGRDPDWHYYGLLLHGNMGQLTDARIVNNTFETPVGGVTTEDVQTASGVWANNIGGGWDCLPGMTYSNNVGKKCDGSDKALSPSSSCAPSACPSRSTVPVGWVDPAAFDFHLTARSVAVNFGSAAHAPTTDRDGKVRDAAPDAGAYEYGAGGAGTGGPGATDGSRAAGRPRIVSLRLRPRTICRRARKGCPGRATLRVRMSQKARLTVRVLKLRGKRAPRRVRTLRRSARRRGVLRIRARGLRRGRHRIRVVATSATGARSKARTVRLRVR